VLLNLFAAAEPSANTCVAHGTLCNDPNVYIATTTLNWDYKFRFRQFRSVSAEPLAATRGTPSLVLNVKLACVLSCIRPKVRLSLDQRSVFCIVIVVKKCIMASPGSLFFGMAQKQDTFGAWDQSYTFSRSAVQTARWID